jgi:hypothetical protein
VTYPTIPAQGSTNWTPWAKFIDARTRVAAPPVDFYGAPLWVRGTSYEAAGNGYIEDLATALGSSTVFNGAAGGMNTPAQPYQYVDDPVNKWTPGTSTGAVLIGAVGDALSESDVVTEWKQAHEVYENQLLTMMRWHRATDVRRMSHSTVTRGTGVTTENFSVPAVAIVNGAAATVGQTVTINLNEATDPGEIVLLLISWRNSASTENGTIQYRLDGGPWRSATTVNMGDTRPDGNNVTVTFRSQRITGVTATSSIEATTTAGKMLYFGYLVMGNRTPPPIILVQPVPLIEVSGQWSFPGGEISQNANKNNASQEKYRGIIRSLVVLPEFADGTVAVADPMIRWNAATDLNADQIHPNSTTGWPAHINAVLAAAQSLRHP